MADLGVEGVKELHQLSASLFRISLLSLLTGQHPWREVIKEDYLTSIPPVRGTHP